MNIVQKEAVNFGKSVNDNQCSLSAVIKSLSSKLYDFKRDRDKLDFLRMLNNITKEKLRKHEEYCVSSNCVTSEGLNTMIFAINQEYENINKYFEPIIPTGDEISTDEQFNLNAKINDILDSLTKLKYGQEIIYEEFDILKQHFNLGKKNWFQLLKIKLIDVVGATILEKSVAENIYQVLSDEVSNATNYIQTHI